jgi:hypothetical protein
VRSTHGRRRRPGATRKGRGASRFGVDADEEWRIVVVCDLVASRSVCASRKSQRRGRWNGTSCALRPLQATGWSHVAHSARGAIDGSRDVRRGLEVRASRKSHRHAHRGSGAGKIRALPSTIDRKRRFLEYGRTFRGLSMLSAQLGARLRWRADRGGAPKISQWRADVPRGETIMTGASDFSPAVDAVWKGAGVAELGRLTGGPKPGSDAQPVAAVLLAAGRHRCRGRESTFRLVVILSSMMRRFDHCSRVVCA